MPRIIGLMIRLNKSPNLIHSLFKGSKIFDLKKEIKIKKIHSAAKKYE